jgi:protein-tyrosine phosphatase
VPEPSGRELLFRSSFSGLAKCVSTFSLQYLACNEINDPLVFYLLKYMDWILPYLAIGSQPGIHWDNSWKVLRENRISLVVDLNALDSEEKEALANKMDYLGIITPDPPQYPGEMIPIFRRIEKRIRKELESKGEKARIYIHCSAGQRRSPTCAMAFLVSEGYSVEIAIAMVKKAHLSSWPNDPDLYLFEESLELWQQVEAECRPNEAGLQRTGRRFEVGFSNMLWLSFIPAR